MSVSPVHDIHVVAGNQLTASQVYRIWQIRDAVFSVEQHVQDADADGIDLWPSTIHMWLSESKSVSVCSYLRVLTATQQIGRVCTRRDRRGRGLAGTLLDEAHRRWAGTELRLGAQAYLQHWYERYGYQVAGPHYDDAGIDHVPMVRPGRVTI